MDQCNENYWPDYLKKQWTVGADMSLLGLVFSQYQPSHTAKAQSSFQATNKEKDVDQLSMKSTELPQLKGRVF